MTEVEEIANAIYNNVAALKPCLMANWKKHKNRMEIRQYLKDTESDYLDTDILLNNTLDALMELLCDESFINWKKENKGKIFDGLMRVIV